MTAREMLKRAVAAMKKRGWCRGKVEDNFHRVCIYGALNCGRAGDPYASDHTDPKYMEARAILSKTLGVPNFHDVITWNNETAKNGKEVIGLLERAAKETTT